MTGWSASTRDLVATTMINHQDHIPFGVAAIRCTCGTTFPGNVAGAVKAAEAFYAHKADAVLTALAEAKVLLKAPE